ncbi:MAG TPA: response regulator [Bacteroidales bacterium]|nr:response regulator [Bacteroidales bacterium]
MKKKFTILLADDNKEFIQNLRDILELKGYAVLTASDGFHALDIIKASPVDLILMDIKMPVMNGVETYKKIKRITPKTPVIMLTAFALEELIQESLQEGAFACLKKPLDFDELFATIEHAIPDGSMILIVDDDENLCRNLMDILSKKGYRVSVAMDSISAIEKIKETVFDILLLDMKLPPLNGLETYLTIRKLCPNIVVVIITGFLPEMQEMIDLVKNNGAYTLLEKPIDIDKLLILLQQIESLNGKREPEKPE